MGDMNGVNGSSAPAAPAKKTLDELFAIYAKRSAEYSVAKRRADEALAAFQAEINGQLDVAGKRAMTVPPSAPVGIA